MTSWILNFRFSIQHGDQIAALRFHSVNPRSEIQGPRLNTMTKAMTTSAAGAHQLFSSLVYRFQSQTPRSVPNAS